jgi:hypothetical protein
MKSTYTKGQPSPQELLQSAKNFYLAVINHNNPQDKETLIAQINQATSVKEMNNLMRDRLKEMEAPILK